jgi:hypothetical protein
MHANYKEKALFLQQSFLSEIRLEEGAGLGQNPHLINS